MSSGKTHYQVMGLAETASPDDIKKAFRKLAREYHPDLHRDRPEMHEVFVRISQAYEVLSDPSRRAAYDLDLRTQARRDTERRSGGFGSASYSQAAAGAGARSAAGTSTTGPNAARNEKARLEKEKKRQTINKVMDDARLAFARGHLTEARRLCQEVLEVSRMGDAYLMLGDIAARQGRWNAAVDNYTLAMQLMPNDPRIRRKFEEAVAQMGSGGRRSGGVRGPLGGQVSPGNRMSYQLGLACFGCAVILFLMFWAPNLVTPKLDWPFVEDWTVAHFASMVVVGFLAGAVLSSATLVDTFHAQLVVPTIGPGKIHVPIGLILGTLGVIFFPLAVAAYALIAYLQDGHSPSIVGMLVTVVLLVFGFWIVAAPEAQGQTLLMGGNVVFIASLFGWLIGDLFRPGWAAE